MPEVVSIPLAALVTDPSVYVRAGLDSQHVTSLADVLRTGGTLPPITVEQGSNRIVDGFHRTEAHRKVYGETGSIQAEARAFADEQEFLLAAIAANATHGRRLSGADQIRAVRLAQAAGAETEQLAVVLHIPPAKVERLKLRIAVAPAAGRGTIGNSPEVALKGCATHLAGSRLTPEQLAAHYVAPGTRPSFHCRQLRVMLLGGLLDRNDPSLIAELRLLGPAIDEWLAAQPTSEVAA